MRWDPETEEQNHARELQIIAALLAEATAAECAGDCSVARRLTMAARMHLEHLTPEPEQQEGATA